MMENPFSTARIRKCGSGFSFRRLTLRSATASLRTAAMQRAVPTLRGILHPPRAREALEKLGRAWRDHWGWVAGLFLAGLGAKLWLILSFGTAFPYWDAWSAEASGLYLPWLEGRLALSDLFRAHNEHRILLMRLYCLALYWLNGQWDIQYQMAVGAILHSAILAGIGSLLARLLGRAYWPAICPPLLAALVLPFAWENTLGGAIYSVFYFTLVLSVLAIYWLGSSAPWSVRWWLGVAAAIAALFATASGFLAAIVVAAFQILDLLFDRRIWRRRVPTLSVCALVTIAGLLLKANVASHRGLQAHSTGAFLLAFGKDLAWPWITRWTCAPGNLFPLAVFAWVCLRYKAFKLPAERLILGLALWVVLQSAAAAYARGADGSNPAWRYQDGLCFVMITVWLSIVLLVTRYRHRLRWRLLWYVGFAIWLYNCAGGLRWLTNTVVDHVLPEWSAEQKIRLHYTRNFLATDDPAWFQDPDLRHLPYPRVNKLIELLRIPRIRSMLPACAREPLHIALTPAVAIEPAFVTNGCALAPVDAWTTCYGSLSSAGNRACGVFESLPIRRSDFPYLEIPVSGESSGPGVSLELVPYPAGDSIPVLLPRLDGGQWQNTYVRAPAGQFILRARDETATGWLAFQEPREMGRLSYWSIQVVHAWKWILVGGLVCLVAQLGFYSLDVRRKVRDQRERSAPGPGAASCENQAGY